MLEIYKGIKIEDTVIIIEKQNAEHQGYLVNKGNQKQLETALSWASNTHIVKDENGNQVVEYYYKKDKSTNWKEVILDTYEEDCYTRYKYETLEGIVHEYQNGKFRFALSESADRSSQGGKLSFWNCLITAPDGKEFLIGINQECLVSLLLNNTFINGKCTEDVWLGRVNTNVGAFTENMEEFEQGKKDKAIRNASKTVKYEIGSILIPSNKVYCGQFYKQFDVYSRVKKANGNYFNPDVEYLINIYSKPIPMHLYEELPVTYWTYEGTKEYTFDESLEKFNNSTLSASDFKSNKSSSVISSEKITVDYDTFMKNTLQYWAGSESEGRYAFNRKDLVQYQNVVTTCVECPNRAELLAIQYSIDGSSHANLVKEFFDKYKIPYTIDTDADWLDENLYGIKSY